MDLVVVGINHRSADLDLREQYAVATTEVPALLKRLTSDDVISEAVVLNTCNRVEIYCLPCNGASPEFVASRARAALGPSEPAVYVCTGRDSIQHLFRVSSSLDSMILGEPQILGQVKEAFAIARSTGTVGPGLEGAFSRAFRAAKRVRTETGIARAAVSVGYVAVELAKTIFEEIRDIEVLLVGAGKMGILAAKNLADSGAKKVMVANRTFERGQKLAQRYGWTASAYGDLEFLLRAVDIVICSTGSPRPLLTVPMLEKAVKQRRYRPLFLIDIAVPRDIEAGCGKLDDVYLYNIDDLEQVSRVNAEGRMNEADHGHRILDEEVANFLEWRRERQAAPTIKLLRQHALQLAAGEAERTLKMMPHLDEKGETRVRKLAEVVANRLTRGAIATLKQKAGTREGDELAAVLNDLFELESIHDEP